MAAISPFQVYFGLLAGDPYAIMAAGNVERSNFGGL